MEKEILVEEGRRRRRREGFCSGKQRENVNEILYSRENNGAILQPGTA